jgi:hypothetical protein
MSEKVTSLVIWIHVDIEATKRTLLIDYTPVSDHPDGSRRVLKEYQAQFSTPFAELPNALQLKLSNLIDYATATHDVPEIDLGGTTARGVPIYRYIQVQRRPTGPYLELAFRIGASSPSAVLPVSSATERLISNLWPSCEQLAWNHLRIQMGATPIPSMSRRKVFLSYRKSTAERRVFVEAIAQRLGREGFEPWFDDWNLKAGDSLPREIAAGLNDAYAIVIVLTADYPGGRWAQEEMETAITQRVERNTKIIPIMLEAGPRPTLLQSLIYIDCTDHAPANYEPQFLRLIDALNEVDLNPYRSIS